MYLALVDLDNTLTTKNGIILDETISDINLFNRTNKLIIISTSYYIEIDNLLKKYGIKTDFYSISNNIGFIDNKLFKGSISILNDLINQFDNDIYTLWSNDINNTYVYKYQERLQFFYPKGNLIKIDSFNINLPNIFIAISNDNIDNFINYINNNELNYNIIAKDSKRHIIRISPKNYSEFDFYKYIIDEYKNYKTVGIGDSSSNLDFINLCDIKVAMKTSELEEKLEIKTPLDNNSNGALNYLINLQ